MKKRRLSILSVLLVMLMLLTACGGGGSGETQEQTKTDVKVDATAETGANEEPDAQTKEDLVVAIPGDPTTLDCNSVTNSDSDLWVQGQMYETLVRLGDDGEIEPLLAESYEWIDDTTIEFKLHEGVKFHNGETLTGEDVLFSLERVSQDSVVGGNFNMIDFENSTVEHDYTVRLVLTQAYAPLLNNLSTIAAGISSKKAVEEYGDDYGTHPIGTGPYELVAWDTGASITMKRFDDYWDADNAAIIPNLEFRIITEPTNRCIELETGKVDIAMSIQISDTYIIDDDDALTLVTGNSWSCYCLRLNATGHNEALTDARVRLALAKAIDREGLVANVFDGYAEVSNSVIASTVWGYADDYGRENYTYDPDAAKALLEEAGYGDGFEIEILLYDNTTLSNIATIVSNQWEAIGVKTTISIYEMGSFFSRFVAEDFDCVAVSNTNGTGDPDDGSFVVFHSDYQNVYVDPEVDKLLEQSRIELDTQARREVWYDIQMALQEGVAYVPLATAQNMYGAKTELDGLPNAAMLSSSVRFADVCLK